jgi:hypothetical protein
MGLLPLVILGAIRFVNSDDHSRSLIPLPDASLALARPGGGRKLSELVGDTLALARREPLFKIGEYEWCAPDYRQILLWAEQLALEPEEVIRRLQDRRSLWLECESRCILVGDETAFRGGRLVALNWNLELLPLAVFRWMEGLELENLRITFNRKLETSPPDLRLSLPSLRRLDCTGLGLEALDLSHLRSLESLYCGDNRLTNLDLTQLSKLTTLDCSGNPLSELTLSNLPSLDEVLCSGCELTRLNLSALPSLRNLECWSNQLETLDLSGVRNLTSLYCSDNRLRKLDIEGMTSLESLDITGNQIAFLDARGTLMTSSDVEARHALTIKDDNGTYDV